MIGLFDCNNFFVSCERAFNPSLAERPVAVLSSNDGCCIARSNEFKALGIGMGTPYFKLKSREESGELAFLSSNFELYSDMSRRVMSILRRFFGEIEQYSVDEAFVAVQARSRERLEAAGKRVRAAILRWTGIPCSAGFAPTRTLAKIANHIAKKQPGGVCVLPESFDGLLAGVPAGEVWGVGRALAAKLRAERIFTAAGIASAPLDLLRSSGGVMLLRTAAELRGESGAAALQSRAFGASSGGDASSMVSCSRSFGSPDVSRDDIAGAIAHFAAEAAEKLRQRSLLASGCNIYIQLRAPSRSARTGTPSFATIGDTVLFETPTDATNTILAALRPHIDALYIPGRQYRKAGICFFSLDKADAYSQTDLFRPNRLVAPSRLYKTVDALNARFGPGMVFSAAEGMGDGAWKAKSDKRSPRYTTRWDEIPLVR